MEYYYCLMIKSVLIYILIYRKNYFLVIYEYCIDFISAKYGKSGRVFEVRYGI